MSERSSRLSCRPERRCQPRRCTSSTAASGTSSATGTETILPARAMVYVVGLLNSLVLDFVVRRKAGSHVTKSIMATLPIADVPAGQRPRRGHRRPVSAADLPRPEFAELAEVLGSACAPLPPGEEQALRAELDARVARLYGLSADQLELVLADFRQSADADGSPVRPDDEYKTLVRREFARLGGDEGTAPAA